LASEGDTEGVCIFEKETGTCRHRCTGETEEDRCQMIRNNRGEKREICDFRDVKNPCFGCNMRSVCGGTNEKSVRGRWY